MKRVHKLLSVGTLGLIISIPVVNLTPGFTGLLEMREVIAQVAPKPSVQLNLSAAKKGIVVTAEGQQKVDWQSLEDNAVVNPGDILRYTITGENTGDSTANNLAVTQPIPDKMIYKLNSAKSKNKAEITYSIDQGETFVAEPTIKVTLEDGTVVDRPAPPEAYTHIRWQFPIVTPEAGATAMYEVKVQ